MKRSSMLDRLSDIDGLIDKSLPEDKQRDGEGCLPPSPQIFEILYLPPLTGLR